MLFVDLFLWQTSVIHISNEGNFPRILLLQELGILITLHRCWSRPLTVHTGSSSTVYGHAIQLAFKSILWANTSFHYLFLFEWNIKIYILCFTIYAKCIYCLLHSDYYGYLSFPYNLKTYSWTYYCWCRPTVICSRICPTVLFTNLFFQHWEKQ